MSTPHVLYSDVQIGARVEALAGEIAALAVRPEIAMPILVGGFIFGADLVRALARLGVPLEIEMLWLRSYGDKRVSSAISMIAGPSEQIAGRHILVIDGVLDFGRTLAKAISLIDAAGAASVRTAVALDKRRKGVAPADFAAFHDVKDFVVGYGMDDAGRWRTLPYIGKLR